MTSVRWLRASMVTALMTPLIPGAGPPPTSKANLPLPFTLLMVTTASRSLGVDVRPTEMALARRVRGTAGGPGPAADILGLANRPATGRTSFGKEATGPPAAPASIPEFPARAGDRPGKMGSPVDLSSGDQAC